MTNKEVPVEPSYGLPKEIWGHVFSFFNKVELAKVSRLNHEFYKIASDETLKKNAKWPLRDYTKLLKEQTQKAKDDGRHYLQLLDMSNVYVGDKILYIFDIITGNMLHELSGHRETIASVTMLSDGKLISASSDKTLCIWDMKTGQCQQQFSTQSDIPYQLTVLQNGNIAYTSFSRQDSSSKKTLRIWNPKTNQNQGGFVAPKVYIDQIEQLSNGNLATSSRCSVAISIWDLKTGKCIHELHGHQKSVECIAVLPNGNMVSGSYDKTLRIWDVNKGECTQVLSGHANAISCVAVLPDDNIISGDCNGILKIWNIHTGKCLRTLTGHEGQSFIARIAVLPDGYVISLAFKGMIYIWDTKTGECINKLVENQSNLRFALLPNNNIITYSGKDLHIWHFDLVKPTLKEVTQVSVDAQIDSSQEEHSRPTLK